MAKTCPLLAQGNFYGPEAWVADGSPDEKTYYRYITEKDLVKLDSIYYCLDKATATHFQGFIASFKDFRTGELTSLPYGQVNTGSDTCTGFYVKEEIQWLMVKQDDDDVEGLVMGNAITGTNYVFKAPDIPIPDPRDSGIIPLPGRLIGFGVTVAQYTRGANEQIVRISMVYNSCNCIGSTFETINAPQPMLVVAGVDEEVIQTLAYRNNEVEKWFGQDCGSQSVGLIAQANPNPFAINLIMSGAVSPKGEMYPDILKVGPTTIAMIGRWNFALRWSQNPGQGVNNGQGQETLIEPLVLPFFVQIDPCPLTELIALQEDFSVVYTIGDGVYQTDSFNFQQETACGYEETLQVVDVPSFVSWDAENRKLVIDTAEQADVGFYTMEVKVTVQVPDDYTKASYTAYQASTIVEIEVKSAFNLPAGCENTVFDDLALADLTTSVFGPATTQQLQPVADSVSRSNGNGDGFTYCGERTFEIIENAGSQATQGFLSFDPATETLTLESFDVADTGSYTVNVKVFFVDEPEISRTQSFTVTVNPCQVEQFEAVQTFRTVRYTTFSGPLVTDEYLFEMTPNECGYTGAVSVTGLPAYATHDTTNRHFEIESDSAPSETFQVTVTSTVEYPTDYTQAEVQTVSASFDFVIIVENPCQTAQILPFTLRDMETRFTGPPDEQVLEEPEDTTGGLCGPIAYEIVDGAKYAPNMVLDPATKTITLKSFANYEIGQQKPVVRAYLVQNPTIFQDITFTGTLNPCILEDFSIGQTSIDYIIGSGQYQAEPLELVTEPAACNTYEPQLSYSGLPPFATPASLLLAIESEDRTLAGSYEVVLTVLIRVPNDYTRTSFTEIERQTSFAIVGSDPCEDTILDDFSIEDVYLTVLGPMVSRDLPLQVQDSVSKAYGNKDGVSFCGDRTFTIQQFVFYGGFLTVNEDVGHMEFATVSQSDAGQYTIEFTVELINNGVYVTKSSSFIVTIDPCQVTSFTGTFEPQMLSYQIGSPQAEPVAYAFTQDAACNYPETIEVSGLPAFVTHDESGMSFSVFSDDPNDSGSYTITVTSTIQVPGDSVTEMVASIDLTLVVEADCSVTQFLPWSLDQSTFETSVLAEAEIVTLGPVFDSVSQVNGNEDGFTFCGERIYTLVDPNTTISTFLTLDNEAGTVTIEPASPEAEGLHTVEVQISIVDHPTITKVASFTVQVDPCVITSFQGTPESTTMSYSVGTPALTSMPYTFTQARTCDYPEIVAVAGMPDFVTHDEQSRTFNVETADSLDEATYEVTITATISVPDDYTRTSFTDFTSTVTYTIIVQEECGETVFDDVAISDMRVTVNGEGSTQLFDPVMDSVSKELGNGDGLTFCGSREYALVDAELHAEYLTLDKATRTITLQSMSDNHIGTYQVQMRIFLADQPTVEKVITFVVVVDPCEVEDFQISGLAASLAYTIEDPQIVLGVLTASQGVCNYPVTYELVTPMPFLTQDAYTNELSIYSTDKSLEGFHTVEIRGTLDRQAVGIATLLESTLSLNLEIIVKIDPCTLTKFDELTLADMTTFVLGDPILQTFEDVMDSESKQSGDMSGTTFCGPRIYSVLAHESLVFDAELREFTLQSKDKAQVGQSQAILQVQLENYPEIVMDVPFLVTVNPCQVTQFTAEVDNSALTYTLGDSEVTSFAYTLTQVNACEYPVSITVDFGGSEGFLTHNELVQDFTVAETRDKTQVGLYIVTVRAAIAVPDDYSMATETQMTAETTFTIEVVDPCLGTQLEQFTPSEIISYSYGAVVKEPLPTVLDTVSVALKNGDEADFCGLRKYTLAPTENSFLTIEDGHIVFDSSKVNIEFDSTVDLTIELADYVGVESLTVPLIVKIMTCKIDQLVGPPDQAVTYYIRTPQTNVDWDPFFEQPDCGYNLVQTITLDDGSPLPSWLVADLSARSLEVKSNDINDQGTYSIVITASTPELYEHDTLSVQMTITLDVKFDCAQDEILSISEIPDQNVLLSQASDPQRITPVFKQILESCPETLVLQKLFSTGWSTLSPEEAQVIRIDSTASHQIVIGTDNRSLDGEVWTLRLTISSYSGSQSLSTAFDVEFRDACWAAELTPPSFTGENFTFELYKDSLEVPFAPMEIDIAGCGPPSHELVYVSGPFSKGIDEIVVTDTSFSGQLESRNWIGTHRFKVMGWNGVLDPASSHGKNGVFGSVLSPIVTVTVTDPCVNSVLVGPYSIFPRSIDVPLGETQALVEVTGPQNTVSQTYGNGFDACGPIDYSVLDEDGAPAQSQNFQLRSSKNIETGDLVSMTVFSADGNGPILTESLMIQLRLKDVTGFKPVKVPLKIAYRECEVVDFTAPIISDQQIGYKTNVPTVIYFDFNEAPCTFSKSYKAVLLQEGGAEQPLPDFIKLSSSQTSITIIPPSTFGALGDYKVQLSSILDNSLKSSSSTTFTVSVINEETEVDPYFEMPKFSLNLSNLVVTVGHSLSYPITFDQQGGAITDLDAEPFALILTMNLAKVESFAELDLLTNTLEIDGSQLSDANVGFYTIDVTATFTNGTYTETQTDKFRLEVRAKQSQIVDLIDHEEVIEPENIIYISDWEGLIEKKSAESVFNVDQPVPYVESLTSTGILTIKWDRAMKEITDVRAVPPTEVLLREEENRRRSLQETTTTWLGDYFGGIDGFEKVTIKKAVEVVLERPDEDDKVLDWSVIDSTSEQFVIQIHFNQEDLFSTEALIAHLSVTFWGTEFFQSEKTGVSVRLGTTLLWPVFNQMTQKQASFIEQYKAPVVATFAIILITMVLFFPLGTLIPTWICINSAQLVAHLPLINAKLPSLTNGTLLEMLSIIRLDWLISALWPASDISSEAQSFSTGYESFDKARISAGYTDTYTELIVLAFTGICVIALVQMAIGAVLCRRPSPCRNNFVWLSNIVLRLALLLSVELIISIVINLFVSQSQTSSIPMVSKPIISGVSGALAILILVLIASLVYGVIRGNELMKKYGFYGQTENSDALLLDFIRNDNELLSYARMKGYQREFASCKKNIDLLNKPCLSNPKLLETPHTHRKLLTTDGNADTDAMMLSPIAEAYVAALNGETDDRKGLPSTDARSKFPSRHSSIVNKYNQEYSIPTTPNGGDPMRASKATFKPSSINSSVILQFHRNSEKTRPVSMASERGGLMDNPHVRGLHTFYNSTVGDQRVASRGGITARVGDTDEFLSDNKSISALHSLGRLEEELKNELGKSPFMSKDRNLKNNTRVLSPIKELDTKRLSEELPSPDFSKGKENYEGGESENASAKIRIQPVIPQGDDNQSDMSLQSSVRGGGSGGSPRGNIRRPQTTLNRDQDSNDLSFKHIDKRKLSESVRVDHDFGTFATKDDSLESKVKVNAQFDGSKEQTASNVIDVGSFSSTPRPKAEIAAAVSNCEIVLDPQLLAMVKSKLLQSQEETSPLFALWFKTIYSGLRVGHPRRADYIYPLVFILRRLIFVAAIVLLAEQPLFSLLVFLACTLAMLVYSLSERMWASRVSNIQQIFNEICTYMLACLFLLCRGERITPAVRSVFELATLAVLNTLLIGNAILMVVAGLKAIKLCLIRLFNRTLGRKRRKSQIKGAIITDISKVSQNIQLTKEKKQSPIHFEDQQTDRCEQGNAFVPVTVSRTSWAQRLFSRKKKVDVFPLFETNNATTEDIEAFNVVASCSGGFHGKLNQLDTGAGAREEGRVNTDPDYDPMGIFSKKSEVGQELASHQGSFKTNGYSQQDKVGLSDFEFQSQNGGFENNLSSQRRNESKKSFSQSQNGLNTQLKIDGMPILDHDDVLDQKVNRSPDPRLNKPYMKNDLGPIFQALNEETPSECKYNNAKFGSAAKATMDFIEEEYKEAMSIETGDEGGLKKRFREQDTELVQAEADVSESPFNDEEQSSSQLDVDKHLTVMTQPRKTLGPSLKEGISVVQEVDEVSCMSKTPGSFINFNERSSAAPRLPALESQTASVINERNTFRPSTVITDSMDVRTDGSGVQITIKNGAKQGADGRDSQATVKVRLSPVGKNYDNSKRLEQEFEELSRMSKSPVRLRTEESPHEKQEKSVACISGFQSPTQHAPSPVDAKISLEEAIQMTKLNKQFLSESTNAPMTRNVVPQQNSSSMKELPERMQKAQSQTLMGRLTNVLSQRTERFSSPQKSAQAIPEASSENVSFKLNQMNERQYNAGNGYNTGLGIHRYSRSINNQEGGHDARFVSPAKSPANGASSTVLLRQGSTISIQSGVHSSRFGQERSLRRQPEMNSRLQGAAGISPVNRESLETFSNRSPVTQRRSNFQGQAVLTGRSIASSVDKTGRMGSVDSIDGGSQLMRTGAEMLNITNAKSKVQTKDLLQSLNRMSGVPAASITAGQQPQEVAQGPLLQQFIDSRVGSLRSSRATSPSHLLIKPQPIEAQLAASKLNEMAKTSTSKLYTENHFGGGHDTFKAATTTQKELLDELKDFSP